ncbi:MAG: NAD(P)H-dependent oxidoreductase subunit E [Clostridiales bacterium]|jgi:NADH:ubiquinone oxidoreductase subunit E|nr:NAD(P)H-dependent oxidoreductase subunit E [Clostridiales bacterium]
MDSKLQKLNKFIDGLDTKEGALITTLHHAQELFGYIPEDVQNHIAHALNVPSSKVYGVVTFYSFFSTKPKGKYKISVCMGTACFVRGAAEVLETFKQELGIDVGGVTEDMQFSLDSIRCMGACGLAPVISVNGKVFGRVKPEDVRSIVQKCKTEGISSGGQGW